MFVSNCTALVRCRLTVRLGGAAVSAYAHARWRWAVARAYGMQLSTCPKCASEMRSTSLRRAAVLRWSIASSAAERGMATLSTPPVRVTACVERLWLAEGREGPRLCAPHAVEVLGRCRPVFSLEPSQTRLTIRGGAVRQPINQSPVTNRSATSRTKKQMKSAPRGRRLFSWRRDMVRCGVCV